MILKTEKEILDPKDLEKYITDYEATTAIKLNKYWQYYLGKNETILNKKAPDPNNPDNRTPVSYARKIITTYTGYAFRPNYTTYRAEDDQDIRYYDQLMETFKFNNENIKTSISGRNIGIYGVAYELVYIDQKIKDLNKTIEPRFFNVSPSELILLYDYSSEPQKKIAIRYYKIGVNYKIEVYYKNIIKIYDRIKRDDGRFEIVFKEDHPNFFGDIPIVAYHMNDSQVGLIEPILPLIDDYDLLISDSFNEFDRFAHAYLILKKMSLVDPILKKEPNAISIALQVLKRRRVFENVPDINEPIKFLTKDIPTGFIEFMAKLIKEQIHVQSHVPDFTDMRTNELSGAAIDRLLFDFENVIASSEAMFDLGLFSRIELINKIYKASGRPYEGNIEISHKRNKPQNLVEFADLALKLKQAEFSKQLILQVMPDEIVKDVEAELERQEEERNSFLDIDAPSREIIEEEDQE